MAHLFVDDLTVIDCSILDPDRGLIGASWTVSVELIGALDKQSMVFDFSKVKKTIKQLIDAQVDHKLLVPTAYSGTKLQQNGDTSHLQFTDNKQQVISHESPHDALCLIGCERIDDHQIVLFLLDQIQAALPDNVEQIKLKLTQEQDYGFYYHYSHGLKKHDGNCQRIAHGHRSRIHIWQNDIRSRTWEQKIADLFNDIYLGSTEDIAEQNNDFIKFAYTSEQGAFILQLPKKRVHIMPNDTTVECIAQYLADTISQQQTGSNITVQAFEGIKKGAFASATTTS